MATRFEIVLPGEDESRLRAAGEEALAEIERLDTQLSLYQADSEITWINARAAKSAVKVEPRLFRLLERCAELTRLTDGAFDITIAPLMLAWGFVGGSGRMPKDSDVEKARETVGMHHVLLDADSFTARFDREDVTLDLGAVGKGYAIERAVGILRECGVTSGLIHGGTSTVYGIGAQPDGKPWKIAIRNPAKPDSHLDVVELRDSALSVSAVRGKSFIADGTEFGHVIDPRTGRPVAGALAAAVIGPSPTDCDALSTALLVLDEPGISLLGERFPGYEGLVAVPSLEGLRIIRGT